MLTANLPQQLQEEFERTVQLLHGPDSVQQALIEAVELWLARQRQTLVQAEAEINNQAFEALRAELERTHPGQWIVIADGKLQGAADSPETLNDVAPTAHHRIVTRIGQNRSQEVELGWQMMFD